MFWERISRIKNAVTDFSQSRKPERNTLTVAMLKRLVGHSLEAIGRSLINLGRATAAPGNVNELESKIFVSILVDLTRSFRDTQFQGIQYDPEIIDKVRAASKLYVDKINKASASSDQSISRVEDALSNWSNSVEHIKRSSRSKEEALEALNGKLDKLIKSLSEA